MVFRGKVFFHLFYNPTNLFSHVCKRKSLAEENNNVWESKEGAILTRCKEVKQVFFPSICQILKILKFFMIFFLLLWIFINLKGLVVAKFFKWQNSFWFFLFMLEASSRIRIFSPNSLLKTDFFQRSISHLFSTSVQKVYLIFLNRSI